MAKAKAGITFTPEMAAVMAAEYASLTKQETKIKARKEELSKQLKDYADKHGIADDKGSKRVELAGFFVGRVARHALSLNLERAPAVFKSLGVYEQVTQTVVQYIPENIEQLHTAGKIPDSALTLLYDDKVSYAIEVKPISSAEEMPTIQQAASVKPQLKFGKR